MALRHFSARGLVIVLAAGLLATGCTPGPGGPSESPTAGTSAPSSSPTPTRTETAEEKKQREAFEAAEKAYRANWAESGRLSVAGGASEPTQVLLDTSTGKYLDATMASLQGIKDGNLRASGPGRIVWVKHGAYSANELVLRACEDFRGAILSDKNGEVYTPSGTRVYDQTITVLLLKGDWKLSDQETNEVKEC